MAKQYTEAQKKSLLKDMKKWPNGLKDINNLSQKAVLHLKSKGKTTEEATDAVMEILKECADDIRQGHYGLVGEMLEMIFFDKDVNNIDVNKVLNDFE